MSVYMNKLDRNRVLMWNPIIGAAFLVLIKIPFGLFGLDSIGIFISTIASSLLVNIHLLRIKNPFKRRFSFKKTISIFKTYKKYVLFQYPANLLDQFSVQFPKQYIGYQFGNASLADLDMSNKVVYQPLSLIVAPIQTVYFRVVSKKIQNGEEISSFTYSLVKKAMIIGIVPIILLTFFGEAIFGFVLGDQWRLAGQVSAILSLSYLFFFASGCITYARVAMGKQKANLIINVINIALTIGLLVGAYFLYGTLLSVICAYAIVSTIFNILNIFITLKILRKNHIRFLIVSLIYVAVTIIILLVKYFYLNS